MILSVAIFFWVNEWFRHGGGGLSRRLVIIESPHKDPWCLPQCNSFWFLTGLEEPWIQPSSRNGCEACCGHGLVVEDHRGPVFVWKKRPQRNTLKLDAGNYRYCHFFGGGVLNVDPCSFWSSWNSWMGDLGNVWAWLISKYLHHFLVIGNQHFFIVRIYNMDVHYPKCISNH